MAKNCFLVCPIGEHGSDIRRQSNQWVEHVVRPVAQEFEYEVFRADDMPNPGIITNQIIKALIECPLVIADLSGANPNVFYELALRHASKLPVVQMVHAGERVPFDIAGVRTIEYDLSDPDRLKTAGITLKRHIQSIEDGVLVDSPVSIAITESMFSSDGNALAVFLEKFWNMEADSERILKRFDELESTLGDIESSISSVESDLESANRGEGGNESSRTREDIWRIERSMDSIQRDIEQIRAGLRERSSQSK